MAVTMERLVELLGMHAWRDKILRTLTFVCNWLAARNAGTKLGTRFALFGAAIGRTRAFTRFLDDLPMLQTTFTYGIGSKSDPSLHRILQVIGNISSQLFFPSEHIALCCQIGVLPQEKASLWAGRSTMFWAISLFTSLIRNTMTYMTLHQARQRLLKTQPTRSSRDVKSLDSRIKLLTLTLLKDVCDFANAINWLPAKLLWSGKLSPTMSASFGVVASVVGMIILAQG